MSLAGVERPLYLQALSYSKSKVRSIYSYFLQWAIDLDNFLKVWIFRLKNFNFSLISKDSCNWKELFYELFIAFNLGLNVKRGGGFSLLGWCYSCNNVFFTVALTFLFGLEIFARLAKILFGDTTFYSKHSGVFYILSLLKYNQIHVKRFLVSDGKIAIYTAYNRLPKGFIIGNYCLITIYGVFGTGVVFAGGVTECFFFSLMGTIFYYFYPFSNPAGGLFQIVQSYSFNKYLFVLVRVVPLKLTNAPILIFEFAPISLFFAKLIREGYGWVVNPRLSFN